MDVTCRNLSLDVWLQDVSSIQELVNELADAGDRLVIVVG